MATLLPTRFLNKAPKFFAYQPPGGAQVEGSNSIGYDSQFQCEMLARKDLNWSATMPASTMKHLQDAQKRSPDASTVWARTNCPHTRTHHSRGCSATSGHNPHWVQVGWPYCFRQLSRTAPHMLRFAMRTAAGSPDADTEQVP